MLYFHLLRASNFHSLLALQHSSWLAEFGLVQGHAQQFCPVGLAACLAAQWMSLPFEYLQGRLCLLPASLELLLAARPGPHCQVKIGQLPWELSLGFGLAGPFAHCRCLRRLTDLDPGRSRLGEGETKPSLGLCLIHLPGPLQSGFWELLGHLVGLGRGWGGRER